MVVINQPPPSPSVVSGVVISHYSDETNTTMYHIQVNTFSGHAWEVAASYSAFERIYDNLKYSRMNV